MNLIEHTTNWVTGEVAQGKIMLVLGILVLISAIAIFRSDHVFLRGSLRPLGLVVLVLCGYGGFQVFARPPHIKVVAEIAAHDPIAAKEKELTKSKNDDRIYGMAKKVWAALLIISALAFFFIKSEYYQGLTAGFMVLLVTMMFLDATLHHRLKIYLEALNQLP